MAVPGLPLAHKKRKPLRCLQGLGYSSLAWGGVYGRLHRQSEPQHEGFLILSS